MKVGILHTAFVGDVALCGLLIEALHCAGHKIIFVSNASGCALYANDTRVSEVLKVGKSRKKGFLGAKRLASAWQIAFRILDSDVEILLVPHRSATSSLIAWRVQNQSKGRVKTVGYQDAALSFLYKETKQRDLRAHECVRILELGRGLLESACLERVLVIGLPLQRPKKMELGLFKAFPQLEASEFFMVFPGSVWATKKYPGAQLAEVCYWALSSKSNLRCVVSGGPADAADIAFFLEELKAKIALEGRENILERVINSAANIPLQELAAVLSRSRFCLAHDSGPMHVACGVGCPTVAIFGPTDWLSGFGPLGDKSRVVSFNCYVREMGTKKSSPGLQPLSCQPCSPHGHKVCPKKHFRCMNDLPSEAVIRAIAELNVLF